MSGCAWPEQRAHLARGEVQNAAAVGVVDEAALRALDDQRLEGAAVAHQVLAGLLPEAGVVVHAHGGCFRSK
jgi:hypothetical protein